MQMIPVSLLQSFYSLVHLVMLSLTSVALRLFCVWKYFHNIILNEVSDDGGAVVQEAFECLLKG